MLHYYEADSVLRAGKFCTKIIPTALTQNYLQLTNISAGHGHTGDFRVGDKIYVSDVTSDEGYCELHRCYPEELAFNHVQEWISECEDKHLGHCTPARQRHLTCESSIAREEQSWWRPSAVATWPSLMSGALQNMAWSLVPIFNTHYPKRSKTAFKSRLLWVGSIYGLTDTSVFMRLKTTIAD